MVFWVSACCDLVHVSTFFILTCFAQEALTVFDLYHFISFIQVGQISTCSTQCKKVLCVEWYAVA